MVGFYRTGECKGRTSTCNLFNYRSCWDEDLRPDSRVRGRLTFLLVHTMVSTVFFVYVRSTFLNIVSVLSVLCLTGAAGALSKALLELRTL
ncbi:hypothetical protein GGR53DRAFT_123323 [Hypoxylon sp. FL1150]|nr:hypothetical protein GGR53DRAFT_123323 [Hypoxylon sp. FL1150]